jgi:hypothetical protein
MQLAELQALHHLLQLNILSANHFVVSSKLLPSILIEIVVNTIARRNRNWRRRGWSMLLLLLLSWWWWWWICWQASVLRQGSRRVDDVLTCDEVSRCGSCCATRKERRGEPTKEFMNVFWGVVHCLNDFVELPHQRCLRLLNRNVPARCEATQFLSKTFHKSVLDLGEQTQHCIQFLQSSIVNVAAWLE